MADSIQLRSTTFTKGHGWLDSYGTNLRNNDVYLGRMRWTNSQPMLIQADCEPGATWAHSGLKHLRTFRQTGTGTADDTARLELSSPLRCHFHPSDYVSGELPGSTTFDARVAHGDTATGDYGSGDPFAMAYDGTRGWFTTSVRAQNRVAATNGAQLQDSANNAWRGSSWDTGGTPAAKWRDILSRCEVKTAVAGTDEWCLTLAGQREGGSAVTFAELFSDGGVNHFYSATSARRTTFAAQVGVSPATECRVIVAGANEIDGTEITHAHAGANRHARWRFYHGQGCNDLGMGAELVSVGYSKTADAGHDKMHSGAFAMPVSYWLSGAAHTAGSYIQHQLDTVGPTGHVRIGFDYSARLFDFTSAGWFGVGATPTCALDVYETKTLTGALVDGRAAQLAMNPTYSGAFTLNRHSYVRAIQPVLAASAVLTDACFIEYDQPAGTHKALDGAAGGADYWRKDNVNGAIGYWPGLATKDRGMFSTSSPTTAMDKQHDASPITLRGESWDGAASQHRDIVLNNLVVSPADAGDIWALVATNGTDNLWGVLNTGTVLVADIATTVLSFGAALGTHPATTNADKTGNAKVGTIKLDMNGTTVHLQCYAD